MTERTRYASITPEHILLYTACPRLCDLMLDRAVSVNDPGPSHRFPILRKLIWTSLSLFNCKQRTYGWPHIRKSAGILIENTKDPYILSDISVVFSLARSWWKAVRDEVYEDDAFMNKVRVYVELDNREKLIQGRFEDLVDSVQVTRTQIWLWSIVTYSSYKRLKSAPHASARVWGVSKFLDTDLVAGIKYVIVRPGRVHIVTRRTSELLPARIVEGIIGNIQDGLFYPSACKFCSKCSETKKCPLR